MTTEGTKRKLVAILSADAKVYSRLMGADEKATVNTIKKYREVMGELIQQHSDRGMSGNSSRLSRLLMPSAKVKRSNLLIFRIG